MGTLGTLLDRLRSGLSLAVHVVRRLVTLTLLVGLLLFVVSLGVQYVQTGTAPQSSDGDTGPRGVVTTEAAPTTTPPRAETITNPWNQDELVVAIEDRTNSSRDFEPLVASAVRYWEAHDDDYAAYTVDFEVVPAAEAPDVVVSIRSNVVCTSPHEEAVGCAPRLDSSSPPPVPAVVRVEAHYGDEQTVQVLKHEFGHLLGIAHCQRPMPLMEGDCPQETVRRSA